MFLNKPLFPGLTSTSRLQRNTSLFIPDKNKMEEEAQPYKYERAK